jgi:hypothetical protein
MDFEAFSMGKSVLFVPESTKDGTNLEGVVTIVNGLVVPCWLTVLAIQKLRCCFGTYF